MTPAQDHDSAPRGDKLTDEEVVPRCRVRGCSAGRAGWFASPFCVTHEGRYIISEEFSSARGKTVEESEQAEAAFAARVAR